MKHREKKHRGKPQNSTSVSCGTSSSSYIHKIGVSERILEEIMVEKMSKFDVNYKPTDPGSPTKEVPS